MSIFSRIFSIGKANAGKALDRFEKPEVMLDQAIRDKEEQIREAKKSIQSCIATERQTKKLLEQEKSEKLAWEQKAQAALKAGKEDLATKALQRSTEHEQKAASMQQQWESQHNSVEEIKRDVQRMSDELEEFRRNKDFIIAQSKAADVKKDIYEAKARISKKGSNVDDLMSRMKAKAERSENEAAAAKDLSETFDGRDSLEKEFDQLDTGNSNPDIQAKLDAMKANMNQSQQSPG